MYKGVSGTVHKQKINESYIVDHGYQNVTCNGTFYILLLRKLKGQRSPSVIKQIEKGKREAA